MLKIIPLGGIGNVTKNMYVYDYNGEIIIVDCGIGFPDDNMPGVDLLIPDITWLAGKESQIRAILLTHGHDDHIAGLPYVLPRLGENIPIFASRLTAAFTQSRLLEFDIRKKINLLPDTEPLSLGNFTVHSIKVPHSVPDTRHFVIQTPEGNVYHGSDFKFDLTPVDAVRPDFQKIAQLGRRGILLLLSDSLRSESPGISLSESSLADAFDREIRGVAGRFIVTTMSSNVHRIQQAIFAAASHNRKVAFIGRSVEQNIEDAVKLGLLKLPQNTVVDKRQLSSIPRKKLCLIIAGSQGQPGSSLVRAADRDHQYVIIEPGDKVVFSADPIPGNEQNVYGTIDTLSRLGAEVSYTDLDDRLHVSGHASAWEIKLLMSLTNPRYMSPIGGTFRHMIQYRKLAEEMGYSKDRVLLLESGQTLAVQNGSVRFGENLELKNIMVDGLGVGDVGSVVLRDRVTMAKEGMVIVILPLNRETRALSGKIEVVSRGFVYMKESKELINEISVSAAAAIADLNRQKQNNWATIKDAVANHLEDLLYRHTQRSPLVIPVIIET
jgi:ribonuclease J